VILGNPPYSGHSANKGKWIDSLLKEGYKRAEGGDDEGYYKVDGQPLKEKNPKWLQDDYVKFIRFGQWKIDQAGEGILGFITNHSYLDNPTFRGMRRSLMKSFNEIYILDLHGNSLKKEKCPDGSRDQNVFDIRQGVAIAIFIKKRGKRKDCKVYHSDLWGLRDDKYKWLQTNDLKTTKWKKITPKYELYLFTQRDEKLLKLYERSPKVTEIFQLNSVGMFTARDRLTIRWTPEEAWRTAVNFSKMDIELARITYGLGKDVRDWKVHLAQKDLIDSGLDKKKIVPVLYRPFDVRYTYYTGKSRGFHCMPRHNTMQHMNHGNIALCVGRAGQVVGAEKPWNVVFCSIYIEDLNLFYRGGSANFPLYLYPDVDQKNLFSRRSEAQNKHININPEFLLTLSEVYQSASPKEILYYIYSILYSNIYRDKYADFLKIDFPRIPFTKDYDLFSKMAKLGKRLAHLHLLQSKELDTPLVKSQGKGDNVVEQLKYDAKDQRVYYNPTQYFEGVTREIWEYQIGGYQVCHKWLKDRKGKRLSAGDIRHYCRICNALQKTIEIQKEIDTIYPEVEKEIIKF